MNPLNTFRIYGPAAGGYEGAYTLADAHSIAEKYELLGGISWIVEVSADGKSKKTISDGTQARRVIQCWSKDAFRRVKILKWWLSCYAIIQDEIKSGGFVADIEVMSQALNVWQSEK
jgi:hypothetical protein